MALLLLSAYGLPDIANMLLRNVPRCITNYGISANDDMQSTRFFCSCVRVCACVGERERERERERDKSQSCGQDSDFRVIFWIQRVLGQGENLIMPPPCRVGALSVDGRRLSDRLYIILSVPCLTQSRKNGGT